MSENILRRYTTLPFLLDILHNRRLTLLDPKSWDDKNDSYFLDLYKRKLKLKTILALCFTGAPETYLHWKIYSGSSSGVCIQFAKTKLLDCFAGIEGIKSNDVKYMTLERAQEKISNLNQLPFVKRYGFAAEKEYRIIFTDESEVIKFKNVSLDLKAITRISISPWLPSGIVSSIQNVITTIDGCQKIAIMHSTLINNKTWKTIADSVFKTAGRR